MEESEDSSSELGGQEVELGEDQGGISTPVKKTIEAAVGGKPVVDVKKPKGAAPTKAPTEDKEGGDESVVEKLSGKVEDKLIDAAKDQVKDKAQEVLGDSKKGKEELADIVIDAFNKTAAERKSGVTVGQATAQVSTSIVGSASTAPVTAVIPTGTAASTASGAANAATSSSTRRIVQGAGRATPPPSSVVPSASTASKAAGITDELLSIGRNISAGLLDGVKGSKNVRMLGMASIVGAAGWIAGKRKDAAKTQQLEYNRQEAIRNSLMSDG